MITMWVKNDPWAQQTRTRSEVFQTNFIHFQEDLTAENTEEILDDLMNGRVPKAGPRNGRLASEPKGGPTTLNEEPKGPGFNIQAGL